MTTRIFLEIGELCSYRLASNKGYRSPDHLKALKQFGPSPLHRQSFYPVWNATSPQEVLEFMQEVEEEAMAEEAPRKVRKGTKFAKAAKA